jgi:O-succinylbenzoic acid--CoA ligase
LVPELVAINVAQGPRLAELLTSVWERGDAACIIDQRLGATARAAQLQALSPTRLIVDDGGVELEHVEPSGSGVEPGDALVVLTSGSAASPRAVVLTHEAVMASALATCTRLGVAPASDRWLCCLPCAHIGGLAVVTRSLLTGTPVEIHSGFDAERVARAAREGVTLVSLVATALGRLHAPDAFRLVLLGGSPPPNELPTNVVTTWGMTETGSGVVYDGAPLDGVHVGSVDGELFVKGPMLARAYRDGTSIDSVGPDGTRGWLATGDAGSVVDGMVRVHGRLAEVITTGGEKVWPADVESVLTTHPGVAEVAVWRRSDPTWGERVVAWVVPRGAAPTLDELREHVATTLAPWAAPKELVVVSELPRAPSGKVARRLLERSADAS